MNITRVARFLCERARAVYHPSGCGRLPLAALTIGAAAGLCGCGGSASSDRSAGSSISPSDFCRELVSAGCRWDARCQMLGLPEDPAQCQSELADIWDGCPLDVAAVELGEAEYDAALAADAVASIDASSCDNEDVFGDDLQIAFTPKLRTGDTCHSKVSCRPPLLCQDITIAEPEGLCEEE